MELSRRTMVAGVAMAGGLGRRARAQTAPLKIGVLTDLSGGYADDSGPMSVVCAQQAAAEFSANTGIAVEVVAADHQLKPDIGAGIARQWLDLGGVDAIADLANSGVALAVVNVCKDKNKVALASGAAAVDLMRGMCNPCTVQWTFDTYTVGTVVPKVVVREGGDSWFLIGADYVGSQQILQTTADTVKAAGGTVVGAATHPFPGSGDFSSYLLQAQASGAKVLGLCNTSSDLVATLKQAQEFGLSDKMRLAVALFFATNVKAVGLDIAKNVLLSTPFYWDLNDRTRAFSERLKPRAPTKRANDLQAGAYAAVLHYLKAAAALGVAQAKADGGAVVARMKAMPTDDDCFGPGSIRTDGRALHPSYVMRVKTPAESKGAWDLMAEISSVPGAEAAYPPNLACSLWNGVLK